MSKILVFAVAAVIAAGFLGLSTQGQRVLATLGFATA
jgi:hypothetical protein